MVEVGERVDWIDCMHPWMLSVCVCVCVSNIAKERCEKVCLCVRWVYPISMKVMSRIVVVPITSNKGNSLTNVRW